MNIKQATVNVLSELKMILEVTDHNDYQMKLKIFSGSSIGMHTRHIIEFFQCLVSQSSSDVISYDNRQRKKRLEQEVLEAIKAIEKVINAIEKIKEDKKLNLRVNYSTISNSFSEVETTLFRELAYNLEHAIHHNALIRIGLNITSPQMIIPSSFGIAPSTIKYLSSLN